MRINLVNLTKPTGNSGDGLTEYTYQIYERLKTDRKNKVEVTYALEEMKRNDIRGLVYTNTLFKNKIGRLAKLDYDVVHVTHQDIGFAAKILKQAGSRAKVVTTVYDLIRFREGLHKGALQRTYNTITKRNISDAIRYSDFIIFGADQTKADAKQIFGKLPQNRVVNPGIKPPLLTAKLRDNTAKRKVFNVGYLGALAYHKNVKMILESASLLDKKEYRFSIYGTGIERENLLSYKKEKRLDNVDLKGFAPEERIVEIYDSFDAFVFPSVYEGFAYPPLEALARGIPVIINKNGKGIVPDEAKRYFFEAGTPKEISQTIESLRINGYDPKTRAVALKYARSLTWNNATAETYSIYKHMAARR